MKVNLIFKALLILAVMYSCTDSQRRPIPDPPVAEKIEQQMIMHGDTRIDFYYWMNDRENPEVIAYLNAENDYLNAVMGHTEALQEELFDEMMGRIKQDDSSAPWFSNGYYYYTRYEEGGEYPVYCRKKGSLDAAEEIILNVPEMAAPHSYFRVGTFDVSTDNNRIAFTVDTLGRRQHTIYVKDLSSGEVTPTGIAFAAGDVVWASDNKTFFYTTIDPLTLRYIKVFRYHTDETQPVEVYFEEDDTYYYMGVSKTKDGKYITITPQTTLSNETLILEADNPTGDFRVFHPRQRDLIYSIDHRNDTFYILTNHMAQNFKLMRTPANATSLSNWQEVVSHNEDVLLENFTLFNDFIVLQERTKGLNQMRIMNTSTQEQHYLAFDEEAYRAAINVNMEMDTDIFRYTYTSLTTPSTVIDYNMNTREKTQVWQQTVLGDFDSENYETRRMYATSHDGTDIPVTLVYRKGIELDGSNPLLQYGYGSYGSSVDPRFNSNLISLLDRGFVYAMAHIRGGQEMGRAWYESGKLLNKMNTFHDFIHVSEFLIEEGFTASDRLFAYGGSAGGLLMGAIVNMRPDLYNGIIAAVPFVDVVTTMLDESIPLTTSEYDEWGNPNDSLYYEYMLSYSPYDQIVEQDFPNILITSGLYDSQVQYWEPTKWAAKLRDHNTADTRILLQTNMEAGHSGASGRFQRLKELALQYAFLLDLAP